MCEMSLILNSKANVAPTKVKKGEKYKLRKYRPVTVNSSLWMPHWSTFLCTRRRWKQSAVDLAGVNHAWIAWLPSAIKWLGLWTREDRWVPITSISARHLTLCPEMLQASWDIRFGWVDKWKGKITEWQNCSWLAGETWGEMLDRITETNTEVGKDL